MIFTIDIMIFTIDIHPFTWESCRDITPRDDTPYSPMFI